MKNRILPLPYDVVVCFTNDIYGAQWTPESVARFATLRQLWQKCGPFRTIFSAGLANAEELTIAADMRNRFIRTTAIEAKFILPLDESSADTSNQVKNILKIFEGYQASMTKVKPRLFVISDRLHLFAIRRLAKRLGVNIFPITSPLSGGAIYFLQRLFVEISRFGWSIFDPLYNSPKITKMNQRRIQQALLEHPPA